MSDSAAAHLPPRLPRRLAWLLIGPLLLQPIGPALALSATAKPQGRLPDPLQAQSPAANAGPMQAVPPQVQAWFDAAKTALAQGDAAAALRLQEQVVAWLQAHPRAPDLFRVRALLHLGLYLSKLGRGQQALAASHAAVQIQRQLARTNPALRSDLAQGLSNLAVSASELGRPQEGLGAMQEGLGIWRQLAQANPAYRGDLAAALTNLGLLQRQ
ncbi:MAG: hypothetical protein ACK52U_16925, partial [Synechococcaceae cyanobacterium]